MAYPSIKTCANSSFIHPDTGSVHVHAKGKFHSGVIKAVYGTRQLHNPHSPVA